MSANSFASPLASSFANPFERTMALLAVAQRSFDAEDYISATATLGTILESNPDHYWTLLLLARSHRKLGDTAAATQCLRTAIALQLPERIGAYYDLAHDRIAERSIHEAATLIEDALRLPESAQTRWYKDRLLFLRALVELGGARPVAADAALQEAYQFHRGIDEMPLLFDWVRDEIQHANRHHDLPRIRYLAARIDNAIETIDYRRELDRFGPGTRVLAIGAMDGVRFDPLWDFIGDRQWQAVLVEPMPDMFEALERNYAHCPLVRCARLAIVDRDGPVTMYRIRPDAVNAGLIGEWALGVSSVSLDATLKFYPELLEARTVEGCTFRTVATRYGIDRVDVLQIDTEGHDHTVLKQIPLLTLGVRLLHVELINVDPVLRLEVFDAIGKLGFRYHFDGTDLTAVRIDDDPAVDGAMSAAARASLADRDAAAWRDAAAVRQVADRPMWIKEYSRNNVADPGHRDFGVPLAVASMTDPKSAAPFSRTIIQLPPVVFPASVGHYADQSERDMATPGFLQACEASFSCGFSEPVAAIGFSPDHALCVDDGQELHLLEESTWHSNLYFSQWFRNDVTTNWRWRVARDWPMPKPIRGLVAHCLHRSNPQYFHWLFDVMPRVWLLRQHSPYADINQWFVGPLDRAFKQPLLDLYGITPDMCCADQPGVVSFEAAVCTGFRFQESLGTRPAYHSGTHYKGWSTAFVDDIRRRALERYADAGQPHGAACLYVSRTDAEHRHLRNEGEARATAETLGFKIVEPGHMTFAEQVRTFAHARLIVGVHGAGLTNIIWTRPGATLLELLPEEMDDAGYRFLSGLAGHRHHYINCRQFEHKHGPAFADVEVDVSLLRSALIELLARVGE